MLTSYLRSLPLLLDLLEEPPPPKSPKKSSKMSEKEDVSKPYISKMIINWCCCLGFVIIGYVNVAIESMEVSFMVQVLLIKTTILQGFWFINLFLWNANYYRRWYEHNIGCAVVNTNVGDFWRYLLQLVTTE